MMEEFDGLSQERSGFRRLYTDDYFDLYLWYERKGGPLMGFQLCYDKRGDPHSLTCYAGKTSIHSKIDDGEQGGAGRYKSSPILVSDGVFDKDFVLKRFMEASRSLDGELRGIVAEAIRNHVD